MEYDLEYVVLQSKYRKLYNAQKGIFPSDWYNIKEYALKKIILKECYDKRCLITESESYSKFHELALK